MTLDYYDKRETAKTEKSENKASRCFKRQPVLMIEAVIIFVDFETKYTHKKVSLAYFSECHNSVFSYYHCCY